jgi:FtsP/CotA-like multicopper oxidase with cupredoxin domain
VHDEGDLQTRRLIDRNPERAWAHWHGEDWIVLDAEPPFDSKGPLTFRCPACEETITPRKPARKKS